LPSWEKSSVAPWRVGRKVNQAELVLTWGSFFFTYAVFPIGVGWLCDRVDVKWVSAGAHRS